MVALAIWLFFWAVDSGQYRMTSTARRTAFCSTTKTQSTRPASSRQPTSRTQIPPACFESLPLLASALMLGLLGGGHCFGMCGGLMGALTLAIPPEQRRPPPAAAAGLQPRPHPQLCLRRSAARQRRLGPEQQPAGHGLRIAAALLLIAMGLYLAGWWSGTDPHRGSGPWPVAPDSARGAEALAGHQPAPSPAAGRPVGGWLPCGLVYSTLLWAASQGSPWQSGLLMLAFGLGTWPALLLSGLAAQRLGHFLRRRGVRLAGGLLVIAFGLWTLPGPHQHWADGPLRRNASQLHNSSLQRSARALDTGQGPCGVDSLNRPILTRFPGTPPCSTRSAGTPT